MSVHKLVRRLSISPSLLAALALIAVVPVSSHTEPDPWTPQQTVQPADLAKELENSKPAPTVVFVGFKRLYTAGHIKAAQYHGTAGSEEGLKEFSAWATSLPRTTNLVIYCGCCPMEKCPNIRPAFKTLQSLGFQKIRVLLLPNDFATDWAGKGLAYDKGN